MCIRDSLFDGHSDGATFAATCPRCRTEYKSCFPGAWSAAAVGKLRCRLTEPKNEKLSNVQCGFCTALDESLSMCISCGVTLVQCQNVSKSQWTKPSGQRKCYGCTGNKQQSASSQVDSRVDMYGELTFSDDLLKWLPRNCQEEPRS